MTVIRQSITFGRAGKSWSQCFHICSYIYMLCSYLLGLRDATFIVSWYSIKTVTRRHRTKYLWKQRAHVDSQIARACAQLACRNEHLNNVRYVVYETCKHVRLLNSNASVYVYANQWLWNYGQIVCSFRTQLCLEPSQWL